MLQIRFHIYSYIFNLDYLYTWIFLYSTNLISDIFQFRMIMVHKTLRLINIGMRLIKHSE